MLRMKFEGAGATDEVVTKFKEGIEKYWSGQFGQKHVTTKVIVVDEDGSFKITVPVGNGRAHMDGVGALTGIWPADRPAWTAVHEMGHGLGLPDRYDKITGRPLAGYRNDIMGTRDTYPSEQDIIDIIRINR